MERRKTRESRQAREARMEREAMEAIEAIEAREATEARMTREEWKLIEKTVEELFIFFVVSLFLMWWFFAPVRDPPIREEVVDVKPKHHIVNVGLDIPIKEYPIEVLRTDELIICSIPLELSWQYLWASASVHVKSHLSCVTIEKDANITDLTSNQKSSFLEMVNPFAWIMWAVRKPEVMQDNCNHEIRVPFVRPFCSIFKFDVPSHLFYTDEVVSINYVLNQFDPILIAYSICGVLLWFLAGFLSKNQYFQFFCQVAIIVFFSIVIAICFIVNSFDIKKKIGAMAILTCSVPLIYKFWIPAIWNIVITFKTLTAIYLLTTTSASMVYFYVQGPIENPRIHNLIKLGIQFVATRLLFMGMTTRIIPLCVILAFIIYPTLYKLDKSYKLTSNFESMVISNITKIKKRYFPEPRKLLSHDEYELQLDEFTYKSLIDLKNYCLSPDCNLREILSRLSKPEKMVHFFTDSQRLLDLDAKEVDEYKEYIISNDLHITED